MRGEWPNGTPAKALFIVEYVTGSALPRFSAMRFFCLRLRRKMTRRAIRRSPAMPPITPPTIAVFRDPEEEDDADVEVEVGDVVVVV